MLSWHPRTYVVSNIDEGVSNFGENERYREDVAVPQHLSSRHFPTIQSTHIRRDQKRCHASTIPKQMGINVRRDKTRGLRYRASCQVKMPGKRQSRWKKIFPTREREIYQQTNTTKHKNRPLKNRKHPPWKPRDQSQQQKRRDLNKPAKKRSPRKPKHD